MEWLLVVACSVALGLSICFTLLKWNEIRYRSHGLPPGKMGWPIFGQTFQFLKRGPDFLKAQRARHGVVFKSHLLGSPTIISMDPELNRYILLNESKGLVPGYPKSMVDIVGKLNPAAVHGSAHKRMRGSLISIVGQPTIKDMLLPKIDKFTRIQLQNLDGKTVDIQKFTTDMAIYISFHQMAEAEASSIYDAFKAEFDKLVIGSIAMPIKLPWTDYNHGLQGRKGSIRILKQIIEKRRVSFMAHDDMLANLLADTKYGLNEEEILDQIITSLYSGYETISTTSMMALKYLQEHPKALQELRDEHFMIQERKKPEEPIDWNDYKSMSFTRAVIFETSRLATVVNGVLRKTTREVSLNGFIIPQGWKIYVYTREINYDPILYPEPLTFNPWRWLDKSLESHNYFFLFGEGSRHCPGKEMGLLKIATFLHYFVTAYRWEEVGGEEIEKFPRLKAPKGLHLRVSKY